ncbi:serine hydrolase domain-containing protein [Antribacter gilvus]|uniref:serine hydrolase n=1 Tax=Antribacter gilvus TaxID=2304675 RepID=UPI000F7764DB
MRTPLSSRWFVSVLSLMLVAVPAAVVHAAAPADEATGDRIDAYVSAYLDRHALPGAAVTVVQDAEVVHEGGYGHDSGGGAITTTTPFRAQSISKSFTAFAVLQLVDAGAVVRRGAQDPVRLRDRGPADGPLAHVHQAGGAGPGDLRGGALTASGPSTGSAAHRYGRGRRSACLAPSQSVGWCSSRRMIVCTASARTGPAMEHQ